MWPKKRIEIIVETPRSRAVTDMLERVGAKGYTVITGVTGRGARGVRDDDHLTDVFRNTMILVVVGEELVETIVAETHRLLEHYAGIVLVSDVSVVRNDHF